MSERTAKRYQGRVVATAVLTLRVVAAAGLASGLAAAPITSARLGALDWRG